MEHYTSNTVVNSTLIFFIYPSGDEFAHEILQQHQPLETREKNNYHSSEYILNSMINGYCFSIFLDEHGNLISPRLLIQTIKR
jgi:hypothetical protein